MTISLIGFAVLLGLIFLGVPLGFALIFVGLVGFAVVRADMVGQALVTWGGAGLALNARAVNGALVMAGQQMHDQVSNYGLTVIPLFVLMGAFIHRSQLAQELYDAANAFVGHRRGGLAMGTIAACGGFGAVCGSSLATAATICRVAMPSMRRFGYADSLSAGAIAAGGTLGIMIPPSVPMVIYGLLAMLILTVPIFAAILKPMGVDMVWFGIVAVIAVELGLITPPIGINVFVVKSTVPDINIWTVFQGVWPFVLAMVIALVIVLAMPQVATFLPELMNR